MKKKVFLLLATLFICSLFGFGFIACNSAHTHQYIEEIVQPTCVKQGYTKHICSCGNFYTDTYTDPLGHEFTNYIPNNNATYEKDGTKTAWCNHPNCGQTHSLIDEGSKLIKDELVFQTLSVNGTNIYGKVPHNTAVFSFLNEILVSGNSKFTVSDNASCKNPITSKTVSLNVGDNTFYILETLNEEVKTLYTVTIRRRPVYVVSFDTGNGTTIESQMVEEDDFAEEPNNVLFDSNYVFTGWDYDFNIPIKNDITIEATWSTDWKQVFKVSENGQFITGLTDYAKINYTDLIIPNEIDGVQITGISSFAFSNCTNITNITLPNNLTSIDPSAFNNTGYYNNESNWDNGVLYIGKYLIKAQTSISGSYSVKPKTVFICSEAFANCDNLTAVIIPDSTTTIKSRCFIGCDNLTTVTLPNGINSIEFETFSGCKKLKAFSLPKSVTSIEKQAFSYCTSLTSAILSDSITFIGSYAFEGCNNITNIVIPKSVTSIKHGAFSGCKNLKNITVSNENGSYKSIDGNLYTYRGKTLIQYAIGKEATVFAIPNTVTSITAAAFAFCENLTKIVLPENLKVIEEAVFASCSNLKEINLPASITKLESNVFALCSQLTSITIPESVDSISYFALADCSNLSTIKFTGTIEKWLLVEKNSSWIYKTPIIEIQCKDGTVII